MNCKNCGAQLEEGKKFCPECGTKVSEPVESAEQTVQTSTNDTTNFNLEEKLITNTKKAAEKANQLVDFKKKYNLGHLGVVLGGLLVLIMPFLHSEEINPLPAFDTMINLINSYGHVSGNSLAFIMIVVVLFTFVMAFFKQNILTIIGSVASLACVAFMVSASKLSVLGSFYCMLFVLGGILMLVSSIVALRLNQKAKQNSTK